MMQEREVRVGRHAIGQRAVFLDFQVQRLELRGRDGGFVVNAFAPLAELLLRIVDCVVVGHIDSERAKATSKVPQELVVSSIATVPPDVLDGGENGGIVVDEGRQERNDAGHSQVGVDAQAFDE